MGPGPGGRKTDQNLGKRLRIQGPGTTWPGEIKPRKVRYKCPSTISASQLARAASDRSHGLRSELNTESAREQAGQPRFPTTKSVLIVSKGERGAQAELERKKKTAGA